MATASAAFAAPFTVRRYWNPANGGNLCTGDGHEGAEHCIAAGWSYIGHAWTIEDSLVKDDLHRFRNVQTGGYFFSANWDEVAYLITNCGYLWQHEGVAYHVSATRKSSYKEVYRAYNTQNGIHLFTGDLSEYSNLPKSYWKKEGVAFYYPRTDPINFCGPLYWPQTSWAYPRNDVQVSLATLHPAWQPAALDAFGQWNEVGRSQMAFRRSESSANFIKLVWREDVDWLGLTTYFANRDGQLWLCYTEINVAYPMVPSGFVPPYAYDGQGLMVHELGHWVSEDNDYYRPWRSLYCPMWPMDISFRTLAAEDIDGMRVRYGAR